MSMKKSSLLTCFFIIGIFLASILAIYYHGYIKQSFSDVFEEDYEELKRVADYLLLQEEYDFMMIENATGVIEVGGGSQIHIQDKEIQNTITILFEKGYDSIVQFEDKGVYFHRWSNSFHGKFKGFAFVPDDSKEFPVQFVVKQRSMSKSNWYYYESDYNEWRTKQG